MKRFIAIIVLIAMIVPFCSCGSGNEAVRAGAGSISEQAKTEPDSESAQFKESIIEATRDSIDILQKCIDGEITVSDADSMLLDVEANVANLYSAEMADDDMDFFYTDVSLAVGDAKRTISEIYLSYVDGLLRDPESYNEFLQQSDVDKVQTHIDELKDLID